jgi:hypothetical protein
LFGCENLLLFTKEALWIDIAQTAVLEKLDDLVFDNGYNGGRRDKPFDNSTRKGIALSLRDNF